MTKYSWKRRGRILVATAALATATGISVPMAPPVQADPLATFLAFYGYVKQGYDLLNRYLLDKNSSNITGMQAALEHAKADILSEIDDLAADEVVECSNNAINSFSRINTMTTTELNSFADSSFGCVSKAQSRIPTFSDSPAILDKLGLALNAVGPIALMANAAAGANLNFEKQLLIGANQSIRAKLFPKCTISVDLDTLEEPGPSGPVVKTLGAVTGHGVCYSYKVATPAPIHGDITFIPSGGNRAFLANPLTGDVVQEQTAGFTTGYRIDWPSVTDYSVAIDGAMAGTSYQVAGDALARLLPEYGGPFGSPIAMTTPSEGTTTPLQVFGVNAAGTLYHGRLSNDGRFPGWDVIDGRLLKTVTAAINWDARVEVFGIDKLGNIYHTWQQTAGNDASWSPWAQLDGQLNSISVARNSDGTLQVFGTTSSGTIHTRHQILGGDQYVTQQGAHPVPAVDAWSPWTQIDGSLSQVSASADKDGYLHLYGVNSVGTLWHRNQTTRNSYDPTGSGWASWDQVQTPNNGSYPLRSVQVALSHGGDMHIFGTAAGDKLFQARKQGGNNLYTAWSQIPGSIYNFAVAAEGAASDFQMLGTDLNGTVYRNHGIINDWSGWTFLGGVLRPFAGGPEATPVLADPGLADGKVTVKWTDESTNEDAFSVTRVDNAGRVLRTVANVTTTDKAGAGKSNTLTDSTPGAAPLCYQVTAYDNLGSFSSASPVRCIGGPNAAPALNKPVLSNGHATVTWTDESTNEDAFVVYRTDSTGQQLLRGVADVPTADKPGVGRVSSIVDTTPGTAPYCYTVFSYDNAGTFMSSSPTACT